MMLTVNVKKCSRCGVEKPTTEFYKHPHGSFGVGSKCKPCNLAAVCEWEKANPEKVKAHRAKAYQTHKEDRNERSRKWVVEHPERRKEIANASARRRYARDPEAARAWERANSERMRRAAKEWAGNNRGKRNAVENRRRANKLQAMPAWADEEVSRDLYTLAAVYRRAGIDAHVDHIVPLQSKLVCGLHTPDNLTVLLARENISKGNRVWPDMP